MSVDKGALRELVAWNFEARQAERVAKRKRKKQDAELREAGLLPVRKPMASASDLDLLPKGSPIYERRARLALVSKTYTAS